MLIAALSIFVVSWPVCKTTVPIAVPNATSVAVDPALADNDGDGIFDIAEDQLAECALPYFYFDSAEPARQPNEPVMLHMVRPAGVHYDGLLELEITYGSLYAADGGYIYCLFPEDDWCNSHVGDTGVRTLVLRVTGLREAKILPPPDDASGPAFFLDETHLAVFPSAGKHHEYNNPRICTGSDSPYGSCPYSGGYFWEHRDRANAGDGPIIHPSINVGQDESATFDVCALPAMTPNGYLNNLTSVGFPSDAIYDPCDAKCAAATETCADNEDGWASFRHDESEVSSAHAVIVRAANQQTLFLATDDGDTCFYTDTPSGADTDHDGLPDLCDRCPYAVDPNQPFPYLDSDGDTIGDVCDNCPDTDNFNQWDFDMDGVGEACDNCDSDPNPDQVDTDSDGEGDACDLDDDDDGCRDSTDQDPLDPLQRIGTFISATCDDKSGIEYASASGDSDGDHLLDCADLDDDNDGIPDARDTCPVNAGRSDCVFYHDCPVQEWWDACIGGGCIQFWLKAIAAVNPDPTRYRIVDIDDRVIQVEVPRELTAREVERRLTGARLELVDERGRTEVVIGTIDARTPIHQRGETVVVDLGMAGPG